MKKLALILALILIPCTAFGLEMLDNTAMDSITGQSGVSIVADDVQMFINIDKIAYIDCDGFSSTDGYGTCEGAPGAIYVNDFQIDVLNVNAIVSSQTSFAPGNTIQSTTAGGGMGLYSTTCGQIPLFYDYGTTTSDSCYLGSGASTQTAGLDNYTSIAITALGESGFIARALTIDVSDELPILTAGLRNNFAGSGSVTYGGVLIGIGTLEIYINSMTITPRYTGGVSGVASAAANNNASYGTIVMDGVTVTTLSGWLEIAPH
ncbi:MAG: DUF6160 family protein [Dissulfuribacterales bacterium]